MVRHLAPYTLHTAPYSTTLRPSVSVTHNVRTLSLVALNLIIGYLYRKQIEIKNVDNCFLYRYNE